MTHNNIYFFSIGRVPKTNGLEIRFRAKRKGCVLYTHIHTLADIFM